MFWAAPIWWVPHPQRGYGGPLVLLAGNAYFLAGVAFLLLAAVLLWSRQQDLLRPPGPGAEQRLPGLRVDEDMGALVVLDLEREVLTSGVAVERQAVANLQ